MWPFFPLRTADWLTDNLSPSANAQLFIMIVMIGHDDDDYDDEDDDDDDDD